MNKKKQQSTHTIEKLLSAAGVLFMQNGYEHTSMQEIAERCGVTRGALYHHFSSKEGILEALCALHHAGKREVFAPILEDSVTPAAERLRILISLLREYEGDNPAYFKIYLRMHASNEPDKLMLKGRLRQYRRQMFLDYVAPLLQAGRDEGLFDFSVSSEGMAVYLLQIEDYTSECMAAALVNQIEDWESVLRQQMDNLSFACSRLLGCEIAVVSKILNQEEGAAHYARTLGEAAS